NNEQACAERNKILEGARTETSPLHITLLSSPPRPTPPLLAAVPTQTSHVSHRNPKMVLIEAELEDERSKVVKDEGGNSKGVSRSGEGEEGKEAAASVSKEVGDGFETASEGNEREREEGKEKGEAMAEKGFEDALSESQLQLRAMDRANDAKTDGNLLFKNAQYEDALLKYEHALQLTPEIPPSNELRAMCHANRGICYLKLGKYEETIKECTKAIELCPAYIKALLRRADAYERLERFEDAIGDYKKILQLEPSNNEARSNILRLEPKAREKAEKMKEEMIGKLKEMGNSILGRFGMNVDNFKAVKDPHTGSYSISFQR
ncbi:Tetratricopeptide repeat protein 1-like protein, partial [Drosera capensis]